MYLKFAVAEVLECVLVLPGADDVVDAGDMLVDAGGAFDADEVSAGEPLV